MYNVCKLNTKNLLEYRSRSSLCTKHTAPLITDLSFLTNVSSNFQRKMVESDLLKSRFDTQSDIILIDLIDERFDIIKVGASLITKSISLIEARPPFSISKPAFIRGSDEYYSTFKLGLTFFKNHLSNAPIFLHNAKYATHYIDDNKIHAFKNQEIIKFENDNLDKLIRISIDVLKPAKILEIDNSLVIGSSKHIWGLAPFH
jgi:hypothetical protein